MNDSKKLKKECGIIIAIYVIFALVFLLVARKQILYTPEEEVTLTEEIGENLGVLEDGTVIRQQIDNQYQYVTGVEAYFSTYGASNKGKIVAQLVEPQSGEVLREKEIALEKVQDNAWQQFKFDTMADVSAYDELEVRFTLQLEEGDQITIGRSSEENLAIGMFQMNRSPYALVYPLVLTAFLVLLIIYCIHLNRRNKSGKVAGGLKLVYIFDKYRFLMKQLVSRDFKTKYKRSVLGVFWSFLNPLLTMSVQYMVFSRLFRFQIPNYPLYLLTGVVLFNGFSDATTQAMNSITGNASLITKVYVPKYIYPISKVLSSSINILFSLIPLFLVAFITNVWPSWALLILPFGLICFILFIIGISFFLSALMVFFRDMQFLWGVITMIWMYATPIIYPVEILEGSFLYGMQQVNPLYHYIEFFRTLIIDRTSPEPLEYLICIAFALLALLIGGAVFKKVQDKFVLYI